jgi:LPS export ABC transporter protein LptC
MKQVILRHWPLIGICILLFTVTAYLVKAQKDVIRKPISIDISPEEGLKLKNIHYTQDNPEEGMRWILDAEEVKLSKDRQFISFNDFRLKLSPEKKPAIQLEGKRGEYNKNSGEIRVQGNVQGVSDNGYRITTEELLYRQKEGCLKTDGFVRIIGPFFSISGRGLLFNLNQETLELKSGVTTLLDSHFSLL